MKNEKIAIIEDDAGVRFFLEEALKAESYSVRSFPSYEDAAPKIGTDTSLVIMDINLPGLDGLSAIDDIKKKWDVPVLIITAYGTKKNALEALKRGASDFFVKPIPLEELKVVVKRSLGKSRLKKELADLKERQFDEHVFHGVVGRSEVMKEIFRTVEKIANKDFTVLITGETGAGKEEIAKLLHKLSNRRGDFIVVNCASIPDNLLESELFGYEKGAFTGATQQKQGKIEVAEKGTLLLDEIGEMSLYLQAKLLRTIETKEIERLGDVRKKKVDVRILATTNRDLTKEIKQGKFRDDLFFRLSQMHIIVPPLRERKEDVNLLTQLILANYERETGTIVSIGDEALLLLEGYRWPGNVRELINVVRRAAIMCERSIITVDDLPLHLKSNYDLNIGVYCHGSLDAAISEFEKRLITEALRKTKGQQARAAKLLEISERSIWYRIKKYGLEPQS